MNLKVLVLSLGIVSVMGCASGESPFSQGSASTTNIISKFSLGFASPALSVLEFSVLPAPLNVDILNCSDLIGIDGTQSTEIVVTALDKNNASVSTGVVNFSTQYGQLSATQCTLSQGTCSVTWTSQTNIDDLASISDFECFDNDNGTVDIRNNITAWVVGVESFTDLDGDGQLSTSALFGAEAFLDTEEPYLDRDDDGNFTPGVDLVIDVTTPDNNHNTANSLYDGSDCDLTTRADCSPTKLIPIFAKAAITLAF